MRIQWLNGGLFIEPESDVEAEAMLVLMNGVKYEAPPDRETPRPVTKVVLGQVERGLDLDA